MIEGSRPADGQKGRVRAAAAAREELSCCRAVRHTSQAAQRRTGLTHAPLDPMLFEMMSPGYSELHDVSAPVVAAAAAGGGPGGEVAQSPSSGAPPQYHQNQAQFEADKRAVYEHPLFPLLALLLEKCELATQTADVCSPEAFSADVQAFIQHQQRDRKPFLIDQPEVDQLMIKAIQVLRIHLLELEKVQELCKDFCNRYITCLKGKMQSENLLRSDYYDSPASSPGSHHSINGASEQLLHHQSAIGGRF